MYGNVGASILSVITESLYDNPIVVFREYVQNSVDSIFKNDNPKDREIRIWKRYNDLYFLDNGNGIAPDLFEKEMKTIGGSSKKRQSNLGYKGIGRLSGVPYCTKLIFINIPDYKKRIIQAFTIDGTKYKSIKDEDRINDLDFTGLLDEIGTYEPIISINDSKLSLILKKYEKILTISNSGFIVIMQDISKVLIDTINPKKENKDSFLTELQWLLPVDFDKSLYQCKQKELFQELGMSSVNPIVKYCNIYYNDIQLFRPITPNMLREYVCKMDLKYATMFHCFNSNKIAIDKNNPFSGIRIYVDNMLLCTENELIQNLRHYGLLNHTVNGQLQSIKGIGAIIYITDKINITANARRTFIEITDFESVEFLKIINEYIDTLYDTRYALSKYASAKSKYETDELKLNRLRTDAIDKLSQLANDKIELPEEDDEIDFNKMNDTDKKRIIKKEINKGMEKSIKTYLKQLIPVDYKNAFENFTNWFRDNS